MPKLRKKWAWSGITIVLLLTMAVLDSIAAPPPAKATARPVRPAVNAKPAPKRPAVKVPAVKVQGRFTPAHPNAKPPGLLNSLPKK